jgi:hypothetical protein
MSGGGDYESLGWDQVCAGCGGGGAEQGEEEERKRGKG